MNREEVELELRKMREMEAKLLAQPATQDMINKIMNNINIDLLSKFRERIANGFTTGEAIELEKALELCDQLPNMSEQRNSVVTMNYDSLCELNKKLEAQVKEFRNRKL